MNEHFNKNCLISRIRNEDLKNFLFIAYVLKLKDKDTKCIVNVENKRVTSFFFELTLNLFRPRIFFYIIFFSFTTFTLNPKTATNLLHNRTNFDFSTSLRNLLNKFTHIIRNFLNNIRLICDERRKICGSNL